MAKASRATKVLEEGPVLTRVYVQHNDTPTHQRLSFHAAGGRPLALRGAVGAGGDRRGRLARQLHRNEPRCIEPHRTGNRTPRRGMQLGAWPPGVDPTNPLRRPQAQQGSTAAPSTRCRNESSSDFASAGNPATDPVVHPRRSPSTESANTNDPGRCRKRSCSRRTGSVAPKCPRRSTPVRP